MYKKKHLRIKKNINFFLKILYPYSLIFFLLIKKNYNNNMPISLN